MSCPAPPQGKCSMFYILPWQYEWMNMYLTFSRDIEHYVTIFISNGALHCSPCFVNFASTFSIKTLFLLSHIWVKYNNNVVLHRLLIFHISVTKRLTLRKIQRTPGHLQPSFTYSITNDKKLHVKLSMTPE